MNFVHSVNQKISFQAGQENAKIEQPSLMTKVSLRYQQLRLLDNDNGFNVPVLNEFRLKRLI